MNKFIKLYFFALAVSIVSCDTQTRGTNIKPLIPKDSTSKLEMSNSLFVFVGEKIDVKPIPFESGDFDFGARAKYRVLQNIYGNYDKEVIEFEAYDHYGTPQFTKFKTVLLFVTQLGEKFYQAKYIFSPLARTRDGRWAGPYSREYNHPYNRNTTVKPELVDFAEDLSFPIRTVDENGREVIFDYPEPYYKLVGDSAVAIYGNYIPELFKLVRDGVLTARELFDGKEKREVQWEATRDSIEGDF